MTEEPSSTFQALFECSRRRLEHDWLLDSNSVALLRIVADYSYACDQLWASIPTHKHFCILSGLHKSTVSRGIKKLVDLGILEIMLRKDETLYYFNVHAEGIAQRTTNAECQAVRTELLELQKRRHGGRCDPDGQMRIHQIITDPAEDVSAEGLALRAMIEPPVATTTPTCNPATVATEPVFSPEATAASPCPDKDMAPWRSRVAVSQPRNQTTPTSIRLVSKTETNNYSVSESDVIDDLVEESESETYGLRPECESVASDDSGFNSKQAEVWRMLVTEMSFGNRQGWLAFMKFERWWRGEVRKNAQAVYEGITDHRLQRSGRTGASTHPGKVITASMRRIAATA